jgi:hydroxyacylglutathione hydrolase
MFKVTPIPAFTDNYIWMIHSDLDARSVAVVDPGDAQAVIAILGEHDYQLSAILITHHHDDHTGGVDELVAKYSVPVYGPLNCKYSGISHSLKDATEFTLFEKQIKVKAVPGHTLDHISYLYQNAQFDQLFCGDTLFLAGCGRVFEGTMQQMLTAMNYFKQLTGKTLVYPTHEYSLANLAFASAVEKNNPDITKITSHCTALREQHKPTLPTSIKTELLINPFMRCDQPDVQESAKKFAKKPLNTQLEVFSAIRSWKNNF